MPAFCYIQLIIHHTAGPKLLVLCLILVQYVQTLYGFFTEWRKNPHWSLSCCLALLLPLDDLQGDIHGMAGTNIVDTQVTSGDFELTTISSAVRDTGAIDVTLEEGEQEDDDAVDLQNNNCKGHKHSSIKCHQGTQTEVLSLHWRIGGA